MKEKNNNNNNNQEKEEGDNIAYAAWRGRCVISDRGGNGTVFCVVGSTNLQLLASIPTQSTNIFFFIYSITFSFLSLTNKPSIAHKVFASLLFSLTQLNSSANRRCRSASYSRRRRIQFSDVSAVPVPERAKKIDENVKREIINHRSLRHPNIVRFKEVILTPTHLAIVMEYASGGELFERICNAGRFTEDEARFFFQQLISGVSYCHAMQVCHRDLKLENTLLDGSPAPRLKICDFGYSKSSVLHSQPKSTVGTPAYIAPEVLLKQEYDGKLADVWSCGVTLYVMLVGAYPFEDPNEPKDFRKTIQRILSVQYAIPDCVQISQECRHLISRIFVFDPAERITMSEIWNHEWFLKNLPADLMDERIMSNQFEEPDQPMQSVDTIMQIISEATVPAAGTYTFDQLMGEQIYDLESESDAESELDIDSSGEIVYAI